MPPLLLTPRQFKTSFNLVPKLMINILVLNKLDQFLLTRRGIEPEIGKWQIPGSFLLKGETVQECVARIGVEVLGFTLSSNDCRLALFEEDLVKDPRGHVVHVIYKYRVLRDISLKPWGESAEMAFFSSIPQDMGFHYGEILKKWYN
jgi:8-oxo-dGTP diphosphatase